jgi:hypothetical protein
VEYRFNEKKILYNMIEVADRVLPILVDDITMKRCRELVANITDEATL